MSRVGFYAIAGCGIASAIAFSLFPEIDLAVAAAFKRPEMQAAVALLDPLIALVRRYNLNLTVAALTFTAVPLAAMLLWPKAARPMPVRAMVFVALVFALGPGLLANGVLKEHWSRPRPGAVAELGGTAPFVPWWDPRGSCKSNCSFVSGEASSAFALLAPAALAPAPWRPVAMGAVIGFGLLVGLARMAAGGHFLSDVIAAALLTAFVVYVLHGWLYRWNARLREEDIVRAVQGAALLWRAAAARLLLLMLALAHAPTRRFADWAEGRLGEGQ